MEKPTEDTKSTKALEISVSRLVWVAWVAVSLCVLQALVVVATLWAMITTPECTIVHVPVPGTATLRP